MGLALCVARWKRKAPHPADGVVWKDEVIATAESNGAPQEIVEALQQMDGTEFEGPDDVMAALG
jgi:hypothetical protein